jgi:uncharacterized protein (TIGR02266 family)
MDNRKDPRITCSLMSGCFWDDSFTIDQVRNVSEGGVFLETSKPLAPKQRVSLRIFFPKIKEPFDTTGEVIWSTSGLPKKKTVKLQGIGIRFSSLEEEQRNRLKQFIRQIDK